jgi:MFS family permease
MMSTYDTCTARLSTDTTPENERIIVQGIMVGGRAMSAVVIATAIGLGKPLSGAVVDALGFRWMFAVLAMLNLLTLPAVYGVFRLRHDIKTSPALPRSREREGPQ